MGKRIEWEWKVCSKCKVFKTWEYYAKDKHTNFWYTSNCKECRNLLKKEYRQTNEAKIKEKNYRIVKRLEKGYKEKEKLRYREWQIKNGERLSLYNKEYVAKRKEHKKQVRKEYLQKVYKKWALVFFWKLKWKILDIQKWKWCLVSLENDMRIWVAKDRLKRRVIKDILY